MALIDLRRLMLVSLILRIALVFYGEWQDAALEVPYTDVDYLVFSDAAAMAAAGRSPFERSTYRYSPLLAFFLVPNSLLHRSWGKLLFAAADLLVGLFVDNILKLRGVPEHMRLCSVAAWLFNPFTFTIGTRGNCEPVVCAMVLWIIVCIMNGKLLQAALWYGLVVHIRIYPIIYSIPFVLVLSDQNVVNAGKPALNHWNPTPNSSNQSSYSEVSTGSSVNWLTKFNLWALIRRFITRNSLIFGLISGSTFFFWTALFFHLYGWEFLNEALLYHLTRTDPRHNFSIYFYYIYLHHQHGFSALEKLISFLPQLMVQLVLISCFARDLPFCLFLQTVAFVAFNKVITAQYFVWFFCLFPLILPWSCMKLKWKGLICIVVWMGSQVHWLIWAYMQEFKGQNVFIQLWLASLLFLAANTYVLIMVIQCHRYSPIFIPQASSESIGFRKSD